MGTESPRHFLRIPDFSREELTGILDRARRMKAGEPSGSLLQGRTLAMIFRKRSTRTRVSFEVGMFQLGGHALFLSDRDSQMGRGESVADTARVLSRYVDGVMIRTFRQEEVEEYARFSTVPVVNGLTDLLHPCQILADLQTVLEEFGPDPSTLEGLTVCWIGDGNNVANSWLNAAGLLGFELRLACPEGYDPDPSVLEEAKGGTSVLLTRDPSEAVQDAHVVTTDVWASMGQEDEAEARARTFRPFQVTERLLSRARPEAIFLHCLPAHRGEEVAPEVIDGPRSRVFAEAENRLHSQKALLCEIMGEAT